MQDGRGELSRKDCTSEVVRQSVDLGQTGVPVEIRGDGVADDMRCKRPALLHQLIRLFKEDLKSMMMWFNFPMPNPPIQDVTARTSNREGIFSTRG